MAGYKQMKNAPHTPSHTQKHQLKVAVEACDHEIIRYIKACLIQTRSTDCNKLYIK